MRPLYCFRAALNPRLLPSIFAGRPPPTPKQPNPKQHLPYASPPTSLDFQSRGIRLVPVPLLHTEPQEPAESSEEKSSRNQRKREARRAVQWGMELATFSGPQIKRILSIAALGQEVFNAVALVKTFGSDVREGKRRQFNYIGRLLREVENPELLGDLIQATKDGDQAKLQQLSSAKAITMAVEEDDEEIDEEIELEEESGVNAVASRWAEGLVDKVSDITNEVYSIQTVEFDRQELRKLVRKVQDVQTQESGKENKAALGRAKNALNGFLRSLAKRMEYDSELN